MLRVSGAYITRVFCAHGIHSVMDRDELKQFALFAIAVLVLIAVVVMAGLARKNAGKFTERGLLPDDTPCPCPDASLNR